MDNNVVDRKEAIKLGLKRYFTGKPCKHGHVVERIVSNHRCVECSRNASREFYHKKLEKVKAYRDKNRERIREYARQWALQNLQKGAAKTAKYRASRLSATPLWLTDEQLSAMESFYAEAKNCHAFEEQFFGSSENFHVDHIVPLQGKNVCGLHVPWNLQILEATQNKLKSNKWKYGAANV